MLRRASLTLLLVLVCPLGVLRLSIRPLLLLLLLLGVRRFPRPATTLLLLLQLRLLLHRLPLLLDLLAFHVRVLLLLLLLCLPIALVGCSSAGRPSCTFGPCCCHCCCCCCWHCRAKAGPRPHSKPHFKVCSSSTRDRQHTLTQGTPSV
jgi:hypothetical protein